jgi:TM2 domain-containing membrane protein YozV
MNALPAPSLSTSSELDATDVLAIVVSVLAPGLGHVILGQVAKGLVIMALVIASCGVGYIVSAIVALDAFLVAKARRRRAVGLWETFPE